MYLIFNSEEKIYHIVKLKKEANYAKKYLTDIHGIFFEIKNIGTFKVKKYHNYIVCNEYGGVRARIAYKNEFKHDGYDDSDDFSRKVHIKAKNYKEAIEKFKLKY
jgi:hypothetical protein